jgi:signal transduction histidine kinase
MKQRTSSFGTQIALILASSLALIWAATYYDLQSNREAKLREAGVRTVTQAQVFSEYSRSTLKRINEFILNARSEWNGDWQAFAAYVRRAQENIDDLAFQVAVIGPDGIMEFSNLSKPSDRVDLSQREHFRVHLEAGGADRLFISKPLLGKVSGKWSIQVTRPILKKGKFAGVLVVSLSPAQFASFAEKLGVKPDDAMTLVRSSGEIMARYPIDDKYYGVVVKDRPFLEKDSPATGSYRAKSTSDGIERIWGYSKLADYGLTFAMGESVDSVLEPYQSHRNNALAVATLVSLMAIVLLWLLYRSLVAEERTQRQLSEIFALSPDGFVSFDAQRRVSYVSPAFLRMTGFALGQVIGLDETAFSAQLAERCIDPARFPGIAALRRSQKVGAGDTAPEAQRQNQVIELSGPGKRILEVGLRESQARIVSQILYFRDITHESEVDRMKSEFLSHAAHELRTPMASIFGFTELLLQQEFDAAERRDFLATIYRQAELMISIINELLDLARIEARRGQDFNIESIDLRTLLPEVIGGFKVPAGRPAPGRQLPEGACTVRGDCKKLTQAISNVLSNAYKYSSGNGPVDIALLREENPDRLGIRIVDHGIGLTAEQRARICERFYRADASGKVPGTGLGMSIVKEIVELHGGSVQVESEFGAGTAVTLWLPAAPSATATA